MSTEPCFHGNDMVTVLLSLVYLMVVELLTLVFQSMA